MQGKERKCKKRNEWKETNGLGRARVRGGKPKVG